MDDQNNTINDQTTDADQTVPENLVVEQTPDQQDALEEVQEQITQAEESEIPSVELGPQDNQDAQVFEEMANQPVEEAPLETQEAPQSVETETIPAEENSARPAGFKPKSEETPVEEAAPQQEEQLTAAPKLNWKKPILTIVIISVIAIGIMLVLNGMN